MYVVDNIYSFARFPDPARQLFVFELLVALYFALNVSTNKSF